MAEFPEEYIFQEYPKYLYHDNGAATIVASAEEQKALGAGWHEMISDLGVETCPQAVPETQRGSEVMPGFVKASAPATPPAAAPASSSSSSSSSSSRRGSD